MRRLEAAGDVQGVIRLVEAWDREGEPTLPAILAQARAFLSLHLMDRAWVRLRQAEQLAPEDPAVLALTARVFVERGWPARARKVVDRLRAAAPDHPELDELFERSQASAEVLPPNARELEAAGDAEQLKGLAERYIAAGSLLRARTLLERVRRADPYDMRAELLLWGLQGEYLPRGSTLASLTREQGRIDEWETIDHTESIRRSELGADPPTAEVTRADLVEAGLADAPGSERFPSLFRQPPSARPQADDEDEVTVATRVAAPLSDDTAGFDEGTDPGLDDEGMSGGDTQIMQVIPGPGGPQLAPVEGPVHTEKPEEGQGGLRQTLDLKAWQQSMGMQTGPGQAAEEPEPEADEDYLEAEDEDLVVLTRREDDSAEEPAPGPVARKGPIEVIEKHPEPPKDIGPLPDAPIEELAAAARPGRAWLRLGLAVALMLLVMGAATLASVRYLHHVAGADTVEETGRAVASGAYDELLQLRARLDAEVAAETEPLGSRAAALALVEAVLWGEYTGRPEQREAAQTALALARDEGASAQELALAEGTLALLEGDIDKAAQASRRAGTDTSLGRGLAARVALALGRPDDGLAVLDEAGADGARDGLLRVALLDAAGRAGDADAALDALPQDEPLVQLHEALRSSGGDVGTLVSARETLRGSLAPRQLGSLFVAEAELADAAGRDADADVAWKRALSVDGHNPAVLYRLGAGALVDNSPREALREFESCVEANPWFLPCRRGRVESLLDLDRLEEAEAAAGDEAALGLLAGTEGTEPPADLPAEASVLLGLAWSQARMGDDGAAVDVDAALARVVEAGARSRDPLDRRAAGRAAALRVELADESVLEERVEAALELGEDDPLVHVRIAQRYEQLGRKAAAAKHLARATRDGPENALAWHARGQFYFEPATMAEATWAWQKYLELDPSGPRATKARTRLR